MPRYIDADNIKLKGISVFDQNLEILIPLSDVRKSLQMTPTADVQEIVRCKDCKHATFYSCKNDACYKRILCDYEIQTDDENFYCAYGEKIK